MNGRSLIAVKMFDDNSAILPYHIVITDSTKKQNNTHKKLIRKRGREGREEGQENWKFEIKLKCTGQRRQ